MEKKTAIIQNLSVNLDLAQSSLPDNVFTLAINYTNVNGKFVATKKSVPAPKDSPKDTWPVVPSACLNIIAGQIGGQHYFITSGLTADYIFDGSNWLNITSTDRVAGSVNTGNRNLWTTCKLGFNTIVNNSTGQDSLVRNYKDFISHQLKPSNKKILSAKLFVAIRISYLH
jgi:hypothetical protein